MEGRTAIGVARWPRAVRGTETTLAYGEIAIALRSNDPDAERWLAEFLAPWFAPTTRAADREVLLSSATERFREIAARRPPGTVSRPTFALDQQVVSLPAWVEAGAVIAADLERSCFLVVEPERVTIVGDAATRRWRFTLQWVFHEIVATRLRRTALDLHAAAVEAAGAAILIVGPKGAGKTTLSFHLMRTGGVCWIANDRAFATRAGERFDICGMPTPVKVPPPTLARFPELGRGMRALERPYLRSLAEVLTGHRDGPLPADLALSPAQVAHQLGVETCAASPLGAIVFPEIRSDASGWAVEPLDPSEVGARLWANLYGRPSGRSEPTLFEEIDGGLHAPHRELAAELARAVPGYRVVFGRDADAPDRAARLLERLRR